MLYVDNAGVTDAHLNLALEEHVLRNRMREDDLLLFCVNAPAIIIGTTAWNYGESPASEAGRRALRARRHVA